LDGEITMGLNKANGAEDFGRVIPRQFLAGGAGRARGAVVAQDEQPDYIAELHGRVRSVYGKWATNAFAIALANPSFLL
jgi:hypothetical protein